MPCIKVTVLHRIFLNCCRKLEELTVDEFLEVGLSGSETSEDNISADLENTKTK